MGCKHRFPGGFRLCKTERDEISVATCLECGQEIAVMTIRTSRGWVYMPVPARRAETEEQIQTALSLRYQGRDTDALGVLDAIASLLSGINETWAILKAAEVVHHKGATLQMMGRFSSALGELRIALIIRRAIRDNIGLAYTLFQIALCRMERGDRLDNMPELEQAKEASFNVLSALRKRSDIRALGDMIHNLGQIAQMKGDVNDAIDLYERALRLRWKAGDTRGEGVTLMQLSQCFSKTRETIAALNCRQAAVNIFQARGDTRRLKQIEELAPVK